jgi:hypothetical protein
MGFLDKMNLTDIKDRVTDLAQSGVAKSKQLAEVAKLKTNNMSEEDAIKKAYVEIGKLYYAERGMAPEGAYVALCEKITTAKTNIEANNARIAELREKEDLEDIDFEAEAEIVEVDDSAETPIDSQEAPAEEAPEAEPVVPVEDDAADEPTNEDEKPAE